MFDAFLRDRKSKVPRLWSNQELKKFATLFSGDIVNVSGWEDKDKEGQHYSDYFEKKSSYTITNYVSEARGFQGQENEIFLDLTKDLPKDLIGKYDVVFNHTVLEHVFEVHKAFENLCLLSNDAVILVVPFLQPMHADYGDFWRFTPSCLQRLFEKNDMSVVYSSFNNPINASVYVFCVAVKDPEKWKGKLPSNLDENGNAPFLTKPLLNDLQTPMVGANAIFNLGYWIGLKYGNFRSSIATVLRKKKND
jgi:hypothetical protein